MNTVIKGQEFEYKILFPESANTPPTFTVKTPVGLSFLTGTGEALYKANWYSTKITLPPTVPSSTAATQWSITWLDGTVQKVVYFDVKDPDVSEDEIYLRELTKFALENQAFEFKLVIPLTPEECTCELYRASESVSAGVTTDINEHRLGSEIVGEIDASIMVPGEYMLIYTTDIGQYHQRILVCAMKFLPILTQVRFLLDRLIKSIDEPQTYLESDILAALFGGIDLMNIYFPITEWNSITLPDPMMPFLQFASGLYLLNSQYMLESDLAFAYSGNTVSLDYDRTGAIESEIGRLQEYLQENLPRAKKSILRTSPGVLGLTRSPIGPNTLVISNRHRLIKNR